MDQKVLLLIIAALVVAGLSLIAWGLSLKRRADLLQSRLGSQSERATREAGASRLEQAPLDRTDNLQIRDLTPQERERFLTEWHLIQSPTSTSAPPTSPFTIPASSTTTAPRATLPSATRAARQPPRTSAPRSSTTAHSSTTCSAPSYQRNPKRSSPDGAHAPLPRHRIQRANSG